MMNISDVMKLKGAWNEFSGNHPQFVKFLEYMAGTKIEEGTVFAVSVKKPDSEKEIKTNLKVTQSDLELIETLKSMAGKK
ncbi:MAG: hypothetical protein MSS69_05440 [Spirochaetales bacterium]|nr:hypothetical protein [Spirochaetales bacterium]